MPEQTVTVFVGRYDTIADAEEDFRNIEYEHAESLVSTFDVAVLEKTSDGRLRVRHKHETDRGLAGWAGFAAGIVAGMVFPPIAPALGIVGAAAGVTVAHFWKGMSRKDVRDLGDMLESSNAALVVVLNTENASHMPELMSRAVELRQVETGATMHDIDAAIEDVAKENPALAASTSAPASK